MKEGLFVALGVVGGAIVTAFRPNEVRKVLEVVEKTGLEERLLESLGIPARLPRRRRKS